MSEKTDKSVELFKAFYDLVVSEKDKYEKAFQQKGKTRKKIDSRLRGNDGNTCV